MDFLLKREKIVIEVKKPRDLTHGRRVGDELIVDIQHYKNHPDCKILLCLVYDPNHYVVNPTALSSDLSKAYGDLNVGVLVVPLAT
jgi:hypothetical protein